MQKRAERTLRDWTPASARDMTNMQTYPHIDPKAYLGADERELPVPIRVRPGLTTWLASMGMLVMRTPRNGLFWIRHYALQVTTILKDGTQYRCILTLTDSCNDSFVLNKRACTSWFLGMLMY